MASSPTAPGGTIADASDVDVFRIDLAGSAAASPFSNGRTDVRGVLRDGHGTL